MTYRNKVYVAFDADNDIRYYRLMQAWRKNGNIPFNFHDAHDRNKLMSYSNEDTIKRKLSERMGDTKLFVLLVGSNTKFLYKFVRWEIEQALKRDIPIVVVNLNGKKSMDLNLCPPLLRDELAVHVAYGRNIVQYAIDNWGESHERYRYLRESGAYCYSEDVYRRAGVASF